MQENKQEKSLIKQNISLYLAHKGVTAYEFYKKSGVTRGVLAQNNGISEENISRFLAYAPDVNPTWLVTGRGDMLIDKQDFSSLQEKEQKNTDEAPESSVSTPVVSTQVPGNTDIFMAMLREKDEIIREQAKEIGRLNERISRLEMEKERLASAVRTSTAANAG